MEKQSVTLRGACHIFASDVPDAIVYVEMCDILAKFGFRAIVYETFSTGEIIDTLQGNADFALFIIPKLFPL